MKIKTNELADVALDWAVATALGIAAQPWAYEEGRCEHFFSTDWSQGGPIIEREQIGIYMRFEPEFGDDRRWCAPYYRDGGATKGYGPTHLIAAMRCFVASRLGDEVEVPDSLC